MVNENRSKKPIDILKILKTSLIVLLVICIVSFATNLAAIFGGITLPSWFPTLGWFDWFEKEEPTPEPDDSAEEESPDVPVETYDYTVTFYSFGSVYVVDGVQQIYKVTSGFSFGENMPEDPTNDGYEFLGWYTQAPSKLSFTSQTKVTSDVKVYAEWKNLGCEHEPIGVETTDKYGHSVVTWDCNLCGAKNLYSQQYTVHVLQSEEMSDGTHTFLRWRCTKAGCTYYQDESGCVLEKTGTRIENGHTVEEYKCKYCNKTSEEIIHEYENGLCTACGEDEPCQHSYENYVCTKCGKLQMTNVFESSGGVDPDPGEDEDDSSSSSGGGTDPDPGEGEDDSSSSSSGSTDPNPGEGEGGNEDDSSSSSGGGTDPNPGEGEGGDEDDSSSSSGGGTDPNPGEGEGGDEDDSSSSSGGGSGGTDPNPGEGGDGDGDENDSSSSGGTDSSGGSGDSGSNLPSSAEKEFNDLYGWFIEDADEYTPECLLSQPCIIGVQSLEVGRDYSFYNPNIVVNYGLYPLDAFVTTWDSDGIDNNEFQICLEIPENTSTYFGCDKFENVAFYDPYGLVCYFDVVYGDVDGRENQRVDISLTTHVDLLTAYREDDLEMFKHIEIFSNIMNKDLLSDEDVELEVICDGTKITPENAITKANLSVVGWNKFKLGLESTKDYAFSSFEFFANGETVLTNECNEGEFFQLYYYFKSDIVGQTLTNGETVKLIIYVTTSVHDVELEDSNTNFIFPEGDGNVLSYRLRYFQINGMYVLWFEVDGLVSDIQLGCKIHPDNTSEKDVCFVERDQMISNTDFSYSTGYVVFEKNANFGVDHSGIDDILFTFIML